MRNKTWEQSPGGQVIILDKVMLFKKGDSIHTCANTYYGWHTIDFHLINGEVLQLDWGNTPEGEKERDEAYKHLIYLFNE